MDNIEVGNNNPGKPDDKSEKEMGRAARNPEATKVSDKGILWAHCSPGRKAEMHKVCQNHENGSNGQTNPWYLKRLPKKEGHPAVTLIATALN